ncbi:MAG: glutamate--tRNA ligase [Casimicrobiaceae bacterium]
MTPVRTRFAPSPTGFLHLGGARTALFAWAFARHHRGTFILRIEDTDVERSTPEAIDAILHGMAWLGLDHDEGPFYQMQRMDRYRAVIADMLARGLAYHCYMQPTELDALRAEQMARSEKPRYDGRWRPENAQGKTAPAGVAPVVRFRNPDDGVVAWDDAVKGRIEYANAELDDLVIARSDGTPTYNFCVVVDDLDMRISHVIRGDDHVNNTPRQINILRALGATLPVYAHLPTVLGEDGTKLSKRHGAVSVTEYESEGFLPDAMLNALARIGWSHGDVELFSRDEFVQWFGLEAIHPAPSRFDLAKLRWFNHEHMKRAPDDALGRALEPFLRSARLDPAQGPPAADVAAVLRDRVNTLVEMADAAHYFYSTPHPALEKIAEFVNEGNRAALAALAEHFADVEWKRETILSAIKIGATKHGLKPPQVMMPLRVLVCGTPQTPAIDAVLALLGRETTRTRLAAGLARTG